MTAMAPTPMIAMSGPGPDPDPVTAAATMETSGLGSVAVGARFGAPVDVACGTAAGDDASSDGGADRSVAAVPIDCSTEVLSRGEGDAGEERVGVGRGADDVGVVSATVDGRGVGSGEGALVVVGVGLTCVASSPGSSRRTIAHSRAG